MLLPINIEDLLGNSVVENNRIEYKSGWNPDSIYRTICAFANDFDDTCGGYIVVGVEEKDGRPQRPVKGIDISQIDRLGKEMIGYNNLMIPYYQPRTFFEKVDGKTILVIWVVAGERRPYKVPDQITAKEKNYSYYIRYNSSTIVAKDEYFNELMDMANKAPFDDRGNARATLEDVSLLLIRDYLAEIRSSLVKEMEHLTASQILEQLNLLEGPKEQARIKNVALMMFSYKPERFFPGTQIDIVFYPKGKEAGPNDFMEVPPFRGPVHITLRKALDYIRNMVIVRKIHKPKDDPHSIVVYNYPYQAIEEVLVNAYYHRKYDDYQPVEVNIMPDKIEIINFGGAERSINLEDLRAGRHIIARHCRNPRLGEFFKELKLTEGRGTGLPTIYDELSRNGSPKAIIDSDNEHTYFIVTIPCHPEFVCEELNIDQNGRIIPNEDAGEIVSENGTENLNGTENGTENPLNGTENPLDGTENGTENLNGTERRRQSIMQLMKLAPKVTTENIANVLSVSRRTVSRDINFLISQGLLFREGGDKGGSWIVKSETDRPQE